jgi:hypothetical protein
MVICGSSRRSLENPLSRNPSPSSDLKYKVVTSYKTSKQQVKTHAGHTSRVQSIGVAAALSPVVIGVEVPPAE